MAMAPTNKINSGAQSVETSSFDMNKALEDAFAQQEAARKAIMPVISQSLQAAQTADQQFKETLRIQSEQADQAIGSASSAYDRLQAGAQNPPIFNKFMGMFDPKYNMETQRQKLNQAGFDLQTAEQRTNRAAQTRDLAISSAQRTAVAAEQFYTFNRQGFLDTTNMIQTGFAIKEGTRKEQVAKVTGASDADLKSWLIKPPIELAGNEGLVQTELYHRQMQSANVDLTNMARQLQAAEVRKMQTNQWAQQFSTTAELEAAYNEGNFPEGIDPLLVKDRLLSEKSADLSFDQAALAYQAGRNDLYLASLGLGLNSKTTEEIAQAIEQLQSTGQTAFELSTPSGDKIPVTLGQLQSALRAKQTTDQEWQVKMAEYVRSLAETQANQQGAADETVAIATVIRPDDPSAGVTRQHKEILAKASEVDRALSALGEGPGIAAEKGKVWAAARKSIQELNDQYIETQPKQTQGPLREWTKTGRMSGSNSAVYLWHEGGNPNAVTSPSLAEGFKLLSEGVATIGGQRKYTFETDEAGNPIISTDQERELTATINDVVKDKRIRTVVAGGQMQTLLNVTIRQLAKQPEGPHPPTIMQALFSQIVDPETGQFSTSFYKENADGKAVFERGAFLAKLAEIEVTAKINGTLRPDQSLTNFLISRMRDNMPILANEFYSTPAGTAMAKVVYGDNVTRDVRAYLDEDIKSLPDLLRNVTLNVEAQMAATLGVPKVRPGLTMQPGTQPLPSTPVTPGSGAQPMRGVR